MLFFFFFSFSFWRRRQHYHHSSALLILGAVQSVRERKLWGSLSCSCWSLWSVLTWGSEVQNLMTWQEKINLFVKEWYRLYSSRGSQWLENMKPFLKSLITAYLKYIHLLWIKRIQRNENNFLLSVTRLWSGEMWS